MDQPDGRDAQDTTSTVPIVPAQVEKVQEVLEQDAKLPPETAERVATKVMMAMWQAPLPPPEILRGYDDVVPGAAKQIVDAFAGEVANRQRIDRWSVILQGAGMVAGVLVLFGMLGLAAYALALGHALVAAGIPTAMAGVAGVFVWKTRVEKPKKPVDRPMSRAERRNRQLGRR